MESFSERENIIPKKQIQVGCMDRQLQVGLWNALFASFFSAYAYGHSYYYFDVDRESIVDALSLKIWGEFFELEVDYFPTSCSDIPKFIRERYFKLPWNRVYDLLEIILANVSRQLPRETERFKAECNSVLKRSCAGYTLMGDIFVPIINDIEIAAIETCLASPVNGIRLHIESALRMLSDRDNPDYRNSIKESISAVEAAANMVVGGKRATLSGALKRIGDKIKLHDALKDGLISIYGYTSDEDGVRHFLMDEPNIGFNDAMFMLVSCSAFSNYLVAKGQEAGFIK